MSWKIVALAGPHDSYETPTGAEDRVLRVPFNIPGDPDRLQSSVDEEFVRFGLEIAPPAEDLLNFAIAAYTADVRVSRQGAFDTWTRDLELHLFVNDVERWEACRHAAEELLSFLTGDHWILRLRPTPTQYVRQAPKVKEVTPVAMETVSLFSGGLDSYVGAIDALEGFEQVALVGHHSQGSGATSKSQAGAISALRKSYPSDRSPFLQFWLSPPKGESRGSETTTRGRSILFLGLGIGVAAAMNAKRLIVPENGFISLNVPLTPSRLGSFSTRTTHPHTIHLFRTLLKLLGISVGIELPYRFRTKGEMLRESKNQAALVEGLAITMSCAHPEAGRFARMPHQHCGRCVPCLIRRAAILAAGMADRTSYRHEDLRVDAPGGSGTDMRVMRLALERFSQHPPDIRDVLKAGPIPGTDEEKQGYQEVFPRALAEIRTLLQ